MRYSIKSSTAKRTIGIAVGVAAILGSAGGALAATGSTASPHASGARTAAQVSAAAATQKATAATPPINGCVVGASRTLEHVFTIPANFKKCPAGSFQATWNVQGPAGAKGATGATGKTGPAGPAGPSGVVSTVNTQLVTGDPLPVNTGGSFSSVKTLVGTVPLKAGTYLVNVNYTATPSEVTSGQVFPFVAVYDGTQVPGTFTNDLFNVGSGALEEPNALELQQGNLINSNFSGSSEITVPAAGETLTVYAFGNDSDQGEGSYVLNSLTVTATALNTAG
jgi:hypothetical protein